MSVFAVLVFITWIQGLQVTDFGARTIVQNDMSNVDEPKQVVARTHEEWVALWRSHAGDSPAPPVDFSKEMVVAVFLGSRPTPGYSAHFIRAGKKGGTLTLQWIERRPEPGVILAQVLTSPALFAAMPKFAGEIKFEKVER